jgi:hypothetical protein
MAKVRLSLDELHVETFEVDPTAAGLGTIRGNEEFVGTPPRSCEGTCMSCDTGPCDKRCTGPASCPDTCAPCPTQQGCTFDFTCLGDGGCSFDLPCYVDATAGTV